MRLKNKSKKNKLWRWWWIVGGILLVIAAFFVVINLIYSISLSNKSSFEDRGIPRINISLNNVKLEEIDSGSKDLSYDGNILTIYDDAIIREFDNITIKGRGNGTWIQTKKPYQIKFDEKVDLFGMGKAKKWYLLANAMDYTNVRTEVAAYLEKMLEMKYIYDGNFIELYIDDEYRGLYYITHAVEIGKNSVDLRDPLGILVELDNLYGQFEEYYTTLNGDLITIKDITTTANKELAINEFMSAYDDFETAVNSKDYKRIDEVVDVDSFAKYYLLSEFSVNPDAYWTSFYFYKDGAKDKIHVGPAWDFDLAFGNKRWENWLGEDFHSPTETMVRKREIMSQREYEEKGLGDWFSYGNALSRTMFELMEIPEFKERVVEIFQKQMMGRKDELIISIINQTKKIEAAILGNNMKWEINDYESEFFDMIEWIKKRYDYFEREYGNKVINKPVFL